METVTVKKGLDLNERSRMVDCFHGWDDDRISERSRKLSKNKKLFLETLPNKILGEYSLKYSFV